MLGNSRNFFDLSNMFTCELAEIAKTHVKKLRWTEVLTCELWKDG